MKICFIQKTHAQRDTHRRPVRQTDGQTDRRTDRRREACECTWVNGTKGMRSVL